MAEQNQVLPEPLPYGKYYLLERVNSGGMAEVYKAKAFGIEGFERLVAVKKILSSIAEDTEFIRMFIDEAKLAGQLQHANIAHIFDLGRVNDSYYIALEYVAGKDLRAIWERARSKRQLLPVDMVCYVMSKVCDGLEYAHNKTDAAGQPLNIVHRDVSPQNILVSYEGEVKLIDFGVAKAASSSTETRVGILKGKLSYMSPEQVRGLKLDRRSDTFAAGVVLYELLTGERLFLGESDFETLEKIRKVEIAPPTLFNPNIPKELEEIVLKALQKSPNQRFQSAHEMQAALQRFMFDRGLYFTNRELAAVMGDVFPQEISDEHQKNVHFLGLKLAELRGSSGGQESLEWDDDDHETQVFGRESKSDRKDPLAALDDFVPPSSDVVWKKKEAAKSAPPKPARPAPVPADAPVGSPAWEKLGDPVAPAPRQHQTTAAPQVAPPQKKSGGFLLPVVLVLLLAAVVVAFLMMGRDSEPQTLHIAAGPADVEAVVSLDGEEVYRGSLPIDIADVAAGDHTVAVTLEGYEPFETQLTIGDEAASVEPAFEAIPQMVSQLINSEPAGARVFVDGSEVGVTPYTLEGEAGATHALRVLGEGDVVFHEGDLTLAEGAEALALAAPAPAGTPTQITSTPEGAEFEVRGDDGTLLASGTTPGTADLPLDVAYTIHFVREGYESAELPFTPTADALAAAMELTEAREAEPEPTEQAEQVAARTEEAEPEQNTVRDPEPERDREAEREREREREREAEARREREEREAEARREREEREAREAEEAQQDAAPGTLNVQSRPAARVYIDGDDTGRYTPLIGFELSAGRHRVRLVNEDFGFDRSYRVEIQPGRTRTLIGSPD